MKKILPLIIALILLTSCSHIVREKKPLARNTTTEQTTNQPEIIPDADAVLDTILPVKKTTMLAVGDIMLSRSVAAQIDKAGNPLLPFQKLADILSTTDFNFGNLESPFSGQPEYGSTGSFVFNTPPQNIQGLQEYNFKVLNLANNHALDMGARGLSYTRAYLSERGILSIGTGENQAEAWKPAVVEYNGVRVGFIGASYASLNDNGKTKNDYVARIEDTTHLTEAIAAAKAQADFVVVTIHAGTEYVRKPNAAQVTFAHTAIEAGADIVIGSHPHWVQQAEQYKGKYIFYSLGNFIFDQMWSQETREGLALRLTVTKTTANSDTHVVLARLELLPVKIEDYSTPRLATATEAARIVEALGAVGKAFEIVTQE